MQTSRNSTLTFAGRIVSVAAALTFACLFGYAQSPSLMMVPVPFITVGAGNASTGTASTSPSASCASLATSGGKSYGDGCPAAEVGVDEPWGATVDRWGNVYFADEGHAYVRVIYAGPVTVGGVMNPAAQVIVNANPALSLTAASLVAGDVYAAAGGYTANLTGSYCNNGSSGPEAMSGSGSGCPASESYIKAPYNPAVDSDGNMYISDKGNSVVYVVLASSTDLAAQLVTLENPSVTSPQVGSIYLIAGAGGGDVDGALATSAKVHAPYSIAIDSSENLYIADFTNDAVRMVNGPNTTTTGANSAVCSGGSCGPGFIHTFAGSCTGGPATSSSGATVTCTALSGTPASGAPAFGAAFVGPGSVATDASGNVYIGDNSDNASSTPTTVRVVYAGGANNPLANLICVEQGSGCTASSLTGGDVYTIAGNGNSGNSGAGAGLLATASGVSFDRIEGVGLDSHGNLYIMDYGSHSELSEVNATTGLLTFLSADGDFSSTSKNTVGNYCTTGTSTGSGPTALDIYGDGCPAPQSIATNAEGNIGIDPSGNLYFTDYSDNLVRKLTFNGTITASMNGTTGSVTIGNSFPATATGAQAPTQYLAFALESGSSGDTFGSIQANAFTQGNSSSATEFVNPGSTAGDSCTGANLNSLSSTNDNQNNDVCIVPVNFTPARAGVRFGAAQITAAIDSASTSQVVGRAYLNGVGNAAEMAIDPGTSSSVVAGSSPKVEGIAVDASGNTYVAEAATGSLVELPGTTLGSGLSSTPYQVAVDGAGNVYVANASGNNIEEFASAASTTGAAPIATYSSALGENFSNPQGVAIDGAGNLYIADTGNGRVIEMPIGNGVAETLGTGFKAPVSVAVDASGNVYVADAGNTDIEKIVPSTGAQSAVALLSGAAPVSVAVDPAGNVYYADSTANSLVEIPASGSGGITVASGLTAPVGVTLDSNGNLYVADTQLGALEYSRTLSSQTFLSESSALSAMLSNIGNQNYVETETSGSYYTQTDDTDFDVTSASSNGCNFSSPIPFGSECGMTALFTPTTSSTFTDDIVFAGNAANASSVSWNLSGTGTATTGSNVILTGPSPSTPIFGEAVSVTVNVTNSLGTPTGDVTFTVDGAAQAPVALANGAYTLSLTGLTVGSHTVSATYAGAGSFAAGSSTPLTFSVAQATPLLSWTPSATTQSYGPAAPTGILDAAVGSNLPGVFTYTATQGSTTVPLTAATVLTGGTWTLTATFTPADNVDYAVANLTTPYTVTTAATTAAGGPSDFVVASNGTANYTSVSAAVLALPSTGGAVYIEPGTYTENDIFTTSNLTLQGLGSTPAGVVITDDLNAATSDQASATMQLTGSNTYVSNLTIQNTYDSENQSAYNAGTLSHSQALALYTTGDRQVYNDVDLIGEQDTLFAGSQGCTSSTCTAARQYFYESYITGNVDYIFGDGATVFDTSTLYTLYHATPSGEATITAAGLPGVPANNYLQGEIMYNSTLTSESDQGAMTNLYLGRPWGSYATNIYVNANMVAPINAAGWVEFTPGVTDNLPTATYGEYDSTGAGAPPCSGLEQYATCLTQTQAAAYTPTTFLAGSDGWNPVIAMQVAAAGVALAANENLTVVAGTSVTIVLQVAPSVLPALPSGVTDAPPTGTATFYAGTTVLGTATLGGTGVAYLTTSTLPIGTNTITAQYGGDSNYAGASSGTMTVTVNVATIATTTQLTASPATIPVDGNVTFTATVSAASGGVAPTGTVTFYNGTTVLGAPSLVNGVATLSNPSFTQLAGTYSITAVYAGVSPFTASTSAAVTETVQLPVVNVTPSVSSLSIANGATGTVTLSMTAQGGYIGTATLACTNLPAHMVCSFNPSTATFTSTNLQASSTLTISTSGSSSTTAMLARPQGPARRGGLPITPALCLLLPGAFFGLFGVRNRKLRTWQRRMMAMFLLATGLVAASAVSGCGGSSGSTTTTAGTYTINVEVTAGTVQMIPLTVTVQ